MNPQEHEIHMQKVKEGLAQIMNSQDIEQIHSIAQSLLAEEESEMQSEEQPSEGQTEEQPVAKGREAMNKFFMERQR